MKVLVIQPAFIGDAIVSLSLAETLHAIDPSIEIYYLVRPESKKLLSYSPSVIEVLTYDKYDTESGKKGIEQKAGQLNSYKFDIIFCLHESQRTIELVKRLSVSRKIGSYSQSVFTESIIAPAADDRSLRAAKLALAVYPQADASFVAKLQLPQSLLPADFLTLPRPIACLAPGSVWQTKRWPASSYLSLANLLAKQGYSIVLTGLKTDIDKEIIAFDDLPIQNKRNYLSVLSLESTAAIIAHSDILVSNDSAPVHIAIATGTQVVDIFGPTVPEFGFAPRKEFGISIGIQDLWCRPCAAHGSRECPIHTHECMTSISADEVVKAVKKLAYP